tara:strand:- start:727 stop:1671 length:945 start_codon:yes stop_codon:yes gene_type:complete
MMKKKIIFLDRDTFPDDIKIPALKINASWKYYGYTTDSQVASRIRDANIIVNNKVNLTSKNLQGAKNLELIAISATGTNIVDLEYCKSKKIAVTNLRNYASDSVAEHVLAMILTLLKQLKGLEKDIKKNVWQTRKVFALLSQKIQNLNGKTIGIIGKGSIGLRVAKLSKVFGMKVKFISARNLKRIDFVKFLKNIDILSIHCPLDKNTENLITIKELRLMKKNSIIINTARGGIVNEKDLVHALNKKIISAAGIDVTTMEPPKKTHPYYKIINSPNFIWTPHTAWASDETLKNALDQLIENINAYYLGKPKNLV